MVLAITVARVLNVLLWIGLLKSSLIGGQPAGLEESSTVLEKLAPSSVVRCSFPPPPSEVLSGDGTEVTETSTKGQPSNSKMPTDTNRQRQRGSRAGGGTKGFVQRRAGKRKEGGRESMSWREGRLKGNASRERRTSSHCRLERGPVKAPGVNVMIHIRPKSLPFNIDVTMNVQSSYRSDSPIRRDA